MKKTICLFLACILLFGLSACGTIRISQGSSPPPATLSDFTPLPTPTAEPSQPATGTDIPKNTFDALISNNPSDTHQDLDDLTFADLSGLEFWFGSGVGAWSTTVTISPDGAFSGFFSDSDMGDSGDSYPNGTRYECTFSGKFTDLKKTGDFTYSMKCASLTQEGTEGEEKIADGVRVITGTPYGFDSADEFMLYLPGKKLGELPEEFLSWMGTSLSGNGENISELPFYGLYNVSGQEGFSA